MTPTTWLVEYHQLAVEEYAALKDNKQKKGALTVADFLRQLGPKIKEPHSKPVKGTTGLYELRPSGGKALVRLLYLRRGDVFKIVAIAPEALVDPPGFDSAVERARKRAKDAYGVGL
jgi:hypothetical protein